MNKTKAAIGASLMGAFALGAIVVAFSSAQEQSTTSQAPKASITTSFSGLEEEEIGDIIRAYLMENPEVIIEAVNAYSRREQLAAESRASDGAKANLAALVNPENGFIAGKNPSRAKVTVIEMYDYHCTFCKRATGIIKEIADQDADVKVVFRELPILKEESNYAAEASLAAREQGKFLDFHFAMMKAKGTLTKQRVHEIAKKQGIDVAKLERTAGARRTSDAIIETHEIAREMGVDGTPAFIVATTDGSYVEVVTGFRPDELRERIAEAKKAAK
ncbi:MAG: thioredoxin domain-containing protein [Alphaproteobacteria bacterium]|nr:thioredoxin domain-containing protein [Alphaproteobacteria bacterium]